MASIQKVVVVVVVKVKNLSCERRTEKKKKKTRLLFRHKHAFARAQKRAPLVLRLTDKKQDATRYDWCAREVRFLLLVIYRVNSLSLSLSLFFLFPFRTTNACNYILIEKEALKALLFLFLLQEMLRFING